MALSSHVYLDHWLILILQVIKCLMRIHIAQMERNFGFLIFGFARGAERGSRATRLSFGASGSMFRASSFKLSDEVSNGKFSLTFT